MKKNVAVVAGGTSSEYVISMRSAQTVLDCLDRSQFEPYLVVITQDRWYAPLDGQELPVNKDDFSIPRGASVVRFAAVYNIIHGTPGEDGKLQGYFDMLGLPYTGCGVLTSAITFSKSICKQLLRTQDIATPQSATITQADQASLDEVANQFSFPCFVKPNNGGSSFGISKVNRAEDLPEAVQKALDHDHEALIEEYIQGQELTCGVYRRQGVAQALPITEVVTKNAFFDFQAKYEGASEEITPARVSDAVREQCQRLTERIYTLLDCRGFVRIDYMLKDETPYFIEANTTPGFSAESIFPQQIEAAGLDINEMVNTQLQEILRTV